MSRAGRRVFPSRQARKAPQDPGEGPSIRATRVTRKKSKTCSPRVLLGARSRPPDNSRLSSSLWRALVAGLRASKTRLLFVYIYALGCHPCRALFSLSFPNKQHRQEDPLFLSSARSPNVCRMHSRPLVRGPSIYIYIRTQSRFVAPSSANRRAPDMGCDCCPTPATADNATPTLNRAAV